MTTNGVGVPAGSKKAAAKREPDRAKQELKRCTEAIGRERLRTQARKGAAINETVGPTLTDVIIAGGGIAGSVTAAALAGSGFEVTIVEPGLDYGKRLAGELIHPPGVQQLQNLGLLQDVLEAGAQPVEGFAMSGSPDSTHYLLPYPASSGSNTHGLTIEHGALAQALLNAVERLPHVTVSRGARLTGLDVANPHYATATLTDDGRAWQVRAQFVVAADGRNSHVRRMAGIGHHQTHLSNMVAYPLLPTRLPHANFGHVFVGGPSPILAYEVRRGEVRIMFDVLRPSTVDLSAYIGTLPEPLRSDVNQAIAVHRPLQAANYSVNPDAVYKNRLVCVGDAGGCCHPLTATGLSACARDATLLRQSISENSGDIPRALRRYAMLRAEPQRTRMAGAEVLYEVLKAHTPEMRLLRQGLLRCWRENPPARRRAMDLLSTEEHRTSALVRLYLEVCRYALPELFHRDRRSRAFIGLSRAFVRFMGAAYLGRAA